MKQDKIWDYFQSEKGVSVFDGSTPRYQFLARHSGVSGRVLNIGIGSGGLEEELLKAGAEVYCLDPSVGAVEAVRRRLDLADRAKIGFSQSIPFEDAYFDGLIMTEVLEHLSDEILPATLEEVRRVLRGGGRFVGTVPANENLSGNHALCPECGHQFHRWGHVRSFSAVSMKALLEEAGFSNVSAHYRAFPDWRRKGAVNFAKSALRVVLGRAGHPIAMPNIYFEASKRMS